MRQKLKWLQQKPDAGPFFKTFLNRVLSVLELPFRPLSSRPTDRRRGTRLSPECLIRYRPLNSKSSWQIGQYLNFSQGGVRILSKDKRGIGVGKKIEIKMRLPNSSKCIKLSGRVVWIKPHGRAAHPEVDFGVDLKPAESANHKSRILSFIADRLCQITLQSETGLTARPARSFPELWQAFKLVYREYTIRRYCSKNPLRMHYSYYSVLPETRTFILAREGTIAGTATLIPDSPCGLPMEARFSKEIARLRKPGRKLAEVGLLAISSDAFQKKFFSLANFGKFSAAFELFKSVFDYARYIAKVTDLVIVMHPKHEMLYRYLIFKPVGAARTYAPACGKPGLLMRLDINHALQTVPREHGVGTYFLREPDSLAGFKQYYRWNSKAVRTLFVEKQPLWTGLPKKVKTYLKTIYPGLP